VQPLIEHLFNSQDQIGESPIWNIAEQVLYWVDAEGNKVHRLDPENGDYQCYNTPMTLTAIAMCNSGTWLSATKQGLYHWERDFSKHRLLADPLATKKSVRLNDAVVDRQGRLWTGSLNETCLEAADGELFCMTSSESITPMANNFCVANGISWSPDGGLLYISNMFAYEVEVFSQDTATGQLTQRRTFITFSESDGMPDGLTVDAEGYLWVALWGGGKVCRYSPAGVLDKTIHLPVANPTRCTFGGADLSDLFVCSAWFDLDDTQRKQQPMAGDLFRIKVDIKGLAEHQCHSLS